jgi:ribosome-binding protein aMBF1 (putative translation factor)
MSETTHCEICATEFEGTPFTVVALTEPPRPLEVCETCAGSRYVQLRQDDLDLVVFRDDYTRADPERLSQGLERIWTVMDELGWKLEAVKLQARSDAITEPYEEDW